MAKATAKYTPEVTALIVADYVACGINLDEVSHKLRAETVEQLATDHAPADMSKDSKIRSIRSVISRSGHYIARKTVSTVTGKDAEKKDDMATRIVAAIGLVDGKSLSADSFAKMNKPELDWVLTQANQSVLDDVGVDETETAETETAEMDETETDETETDKTETDETETDETETADEVTS